METLVAEFFSLEVTPISGVLKLLFSFILGAVIGIERQTRRQTAGMRTFALISMASTAAMLLSIWIPQSFPNFLNGDPGRIAAQILTGIGFLGAGAIIQSKGSVHGLTTAACIWVVAIVGMCVGAAMYLPAIVLTLLSLFILLALERIEKRRSLVGQVKILSIEFETDAPEIDKIQDIMKTYSIYIFDIAVNRNFKDKNSKIQVKIQVKQRETLDDLFDSIRQLGNVKEISLNIY